MYCPPPNLLPLKTILKTSYMMTNHLYSIVLVHHVSNVAFDILKFSNLVSLTASLPHYLTTFASLDAAILPLYLETWDRKQHHFMIDFDTFLAMVIITFEGVNTCNMEMFSINKMVGQLHECSIFLVSEYLCCLSLEIIG